MRLNEKKDFIYEYLRSEGGETLIGKNHNYEQIVNKVGFKKKVTKYLGGGYHRELG